MNAAGDVVGEHAEGPCCGRPAAPQPVPLQDLLPGGPVHGLNKVTDINDDGWIVGRPRWEQDDEAHPSVPVMLRPAAQPPAITDLAVEQRAVPSGDWVDVPAEGTDRRQHRARRRDRDQP